MWYSILELKKNGFKTLELGAFYEEKRSTNYLKKWSLTEERFNKFKMGFGPNIINSYYFMKDF